MAKFVVVAIRDQAVARFNRPWCVPTLNVGIRAFSDAVKAPGAENGFQSHPDDYALFEIGTYDDESGELVTRDGGPKQVALAREFVK